MTDVPGSVELAFSVVFTLVAGTAFFFVTRSLQRGAGTQRWTVRVGLGVLWILSYALSVLAAGLLLQVFGITGPPIDTALGIVIVVGIVAMVIRLLTWRRPQTPRTAAGPLAPAPISGAIQPLPSWYGVTGSATVSPPAVTAPPPQRPLLRAAFEGLALPLRRPLLFVPFMFYMLVYSLALQVFGARIEDLGNPNLAPSRLVIIGAVTAALFPVFTMALETTSHMAAEAEVGRPIHLTQSLRLALSRLLNVVVVNVLYGLGVAAGLLLLIVPGIVLAVRWMLVTQAVMVGGADIGEAFVVSSRVTRGRWWRFAGVLVLVSLSVAAMNWALELVPAVGRLAAGWLQFAWGTIALTLAYVRAGGPVRQT